MIDVNAEINNGAPSQADQQQLSYAEMAKDGEWKKVEYRSHRKIKNRFIGKSGTAGTTHSSKFKAAERFIPILITNIHKETSQTDIIEYILEKTQISVKLEQIIMKDKSKLHNAFRFNVPSQHVGMFLDETFWPKDIIFRRFVPSKQKYMNVNTANPATATSATCPTIATRATNHLSN